MGEHKSHRVKIANLIASKPLVRCQTRSYAAPVVLTCAAGYILAVGPQRYYAVPVAFAALMLLCLPNHVLFEGYDKYIVIYQPHDKVNCLVIYLSEIAHWNVVLDQTRNRCLRLVLNDDEVILIPGIIGRPLLHYFAVAMADKKIIDTTDPKDKMRDLL